MPVLRSALAAAMLTALLIDDLVAVPLRVAPGGTDLRAAPADTAFVVSQVLGGETVETRGDRTGDWVSVVPPARISLWMYSDLVRNGIVIAPKVEVRAGPGIDYETVGSVKKGDQLSVRGNQGAWLEIAPPEGCLLWVRSARLGAGAPAAAREVPTAPQSVSPAAPPAQVQPPSPPVRQATPPVSAPPAVAARTAAPNPKPAPSSSPEARVSAPTQRAQPPVAVKPPARLPPQQDRVQETVRPAPPAPQAQAAVLLPRGAEAVNHVTVEGTVRPRGVLYRYMDFPYRLARRDEYGRTVTVCVLQAPAQMDLSRYSGQPVRLAGRQYMVKGWRYPLVVADKIDALPAEPAPVTGPAYR